MRRQKDGSYTRDWYIAALILASLLAIPFFIRRAYEEWK